MARYKKKDSEGEEILKKFEACLKEGVDWCEDEHDRCEENGKYERGQQWSEGDVDRQKNKERPALPLNSIVKILNAVANREIMERIAPRYFGRTDEDHGIAEAMEAMGRWQRDTSETEHEESMAFRACVSSGYGVMHKWWNDTALDGLGMVQDENLPVWYMLWDSKSRKQNLVDRNWHMCGKYVPLSEARELFGDVSKDAKRLFAEMSADNSAMALNKEHYSKANVSGGRWGWSDILSGGKWFLRAEREVFLVEFEWKERKAVWKLAMPVRFAEAQQFVSGMLPQIDIGRQDEQGQPLPMTSDEFMTLDENARTNFIMSLLQETEIQVVDSKAEVDQFLADYEQLTGQEFDPYRKVLRDNYRYAIVCENVVVDRGDRPMGYTYEFLTGFPFEQRSGMRFFGMTDIAKGPQDMKNVFFSNMLAMYMTSPKQQLIVESGAVEDTNRFGEEYGKLSGIQFVPDGFISGGRFMQLSAPSFPPMVQELVGLMENAVQDLFGLSSIEQGTQGDLRRVSGNVVNSAKEASNTILAILFDGLRRYRKRWAMANARFLQMQYTPQQMARVVGGEAGQFISGMENWPDINRFDIKIDESPTSLSEQMETVDFLTRTGTLEKWVDTNKVAFEDAIDMMVNLPKSFREKVKRNYSTIQQLNQEIQARDSEIQQLQQKQQSWLMFLDSFVDGGKEIIKQFDTLQQIASTMNQPQEQAESQAQSAPTN